MLEDSPLLFPVKIMGYQAGVRIANKSKFEGILPMFIWKMSGYFIGRMMLA